MINVLENIGIVGIYLNIINVRFDKSTANIIWNREKLEETTLKSGMIQGCPPHPVLSNIVLNKLTTIIRQEKEIGWI